MSEDSEQRVNRKYHIELGDALLGLINGLTQTLVSVTGSWQRIIATGIVIFIFYIGANVDDIVKIINAVKGVPQSIHIK